jgi:hypothetical protein
MRRSSSPPWALVAFALIGVGCEGSPETAPPPGTYAMEVVAGGTPPTLEVTSAVPVLPSVRVVDAAGNPVAGIGVLFAPTKGAATVTGAERVTDADGVATVGSWVLGSRAGEYRLTAVITRATGLTAEFAATAVPGDSIAVTLSLAEAVVAAGAETAPIRVVAVDAHGNVVADQGSPTLTVDDPLVAEITGGGGLRGLMSGRTIVVAQFAGERFLLPVRVGSASSSVLGIGLTSAYGMVVTSSGTVLVNRGPEMPNLVEINPNVGSVAARPSGVLYLSGLYIPPEGTPWYAFSDANTEWLFVVDPVSGVATDSINVFFEFGSAFFAFAGQGASVVLGRQGTLQRIDRNTRDVISVTPGVGRPMVAHPTEPWLFITDGATITKRNLHSLAVMASVPGTEAIGALSPDGTELYGVAGSTLTAFSTADLSRVRSFPLPVPHGSDARFAISPGGARLFVTAGGRIRTFDTVTGAVLEDRGLLAAVERMAYVPTLPGLLITASTSNLAQIIR